MLILKQIKKKYNIIIKFLLLLIIKFSLTANIYASEDDIFWFPFTNVQLDEINKSINKKAWEHKFKLTAGGSWFAGNVQSLIGSYNSKYVAKYPNIIEIGLEISGRYSEFKGNKNSNTHLARLNPELLLFDENISITYIGTISTSQFQDIYLRTTHEIGLSYRFLKQVWWIDYSISAAPQYEYEENWTRIIKKEIWRLSIINELSIFFSKDKKNNFDIRFSYTGRMKDFKDYKTRMTATLKLNIAGIFITENKFHWQYNSIPIELSIYKNDYSFTTSIGIEI
jgi:hypothetical protein